MQVAIVVITYNGEKDIGQFLDSFHDTSSMKGLSLIVVDNNSIDTTRDKVVQLAPRSHLIRNMENKGFAGAANQGFEYAIASGAEYIFLVNQDIIFRKGWLDPLVEVMEKDASISAVQPLIMLDPERELINSCGNALHFLGFGFTRGYRKTLQEFSCGGPTEVAYCSGAAVLYRASALKHIGLFDEDFFMYHEDTDLSWRMRIAGYRCLIEPRSVVYHHYEFSRSIQKFYFMERNRFVIFLKNYEIKTLILLVPLFLLWEFGLLFYSLFVSLAGKQTLTLKEKLRAYGYFFSFRNIGKIIKQRYDIHRIRTVRDSRIVSLFTPEIQFQDIDNPLLRRVANPITKGYIALIKRFI